MNKLIPYIILLTIVLLFCGGCRNTKKIMTKNNQSLSDTNIYTVRTIDTLTNKNIRERNTEFINYTSQKKLTILDYYKTAYNEIEKMLTGFNPLNFKQAVFITENAYFEEKLDVEKFNHEISSLTQVAKMWMEVNKLNHYNENDSLDILKNGAIFHIMKDTIFLFNHLPLHTPFKYDFEDFSGEENWTKQFVVKLLSTGSGNCHSLPYLYKILADELQTKAYLSLAPNHIYIKNKSKKWGWYNTELTSGEFPTDGWMKASGYITLNAIRNGIYMDTLSNKQSVALCVYDLAKGYISLTKNFTDGFVLNCCDLVLKHYPNNINTLILKAETLRSLSEHYKNLGENQKAEQTLAQIQNLYVECLNLGYREMPKQMYVNWLASIQQQKEQFINSKINPIFETR